MKQVLRKGIKDIVVEEVPDPLCPPQHVLINPVYSLISAGTETASIHRDGLVKEVAENPSHIRKVLDVMKTNGPVPTIREVRAKFQELAVLGYSGAGRVAEVHSTTQDLTPGTAVAYGGEGTGHAETIVTGRNLVARLPEGVGFRDACFTTLGAIAMNAVRVAGIGLGENVVVLGLGLVGQLVAQLARLQGGVVLALDLNQDRVDLAAKLGAAAGLEGGPAGPARVRALTGGRGADCVIIAAAAHSSAPCLAALEMCRDRGRIVVVGAVEMSFPWEAMYLKEIQVLMARAYGPGSYDPAYEKRGQDYPVAYVRWTEQRNMEEFLRLVAAGSIQLEPLVSHEFPLAEAPRAYTIIMDSAVSSLGVLLKYPAADAPETKFRPVRKVVVSSGLSPKQDLKVALVGAGNLARWAHLPALQRIPGVKVHAMHSSAGFRGKSYAARFGAQYCTTDYDEILRDPEVDIVLIVTRNQHHASQSLAALRAGKHVFVEKPMALTEEECRDLARAVADSGRQLTVGFNRRFSEFYRPLHDHLARRSGPVVISCRVNSPGISGSYWMADPAIGGAILGEACHFVDLMAWLLGAEPIKVSAFSLPTDQPDPVGQNNIAATFLFADGSIANLTYCTVGTRTSGGERIEVFGQGLGLMSEDFKSLEIRGAVKRKHTKWFAAKGYQEQLNSFVESLRQGRPAEVTVRDGARATVGCLRMLEAARTRECQTIDLDAVLGADPSE